jgi:Zn-dependent M28 family amino/carboxypeptidase
MTSAPLPMTYVGAATQPAISACDLMARLYRFADDSMGGRRVGTPDHERATGMIATELKRLGLRPAGDNGTYFQSLPLVSRAIDTASIIAVDGATLRAGTDFLVTTLSAHPEEYAHVTLIYGGTLLDTTVTLFSTPTPGTIVLFRPAVPGLNSAAVQRTAKGRAWVAWYNAFRNRASAATPQISPAQVRTATNPTAMVMLSEKDAPITLTLTTSAAEKLFGAPLDGVPVGAASKSLTATLKFIDTPRLSRNVIAVLPGTGAALKGEYVALTAHADHLGTLRAPVDHDSVRAAHIGTRAGAEGAASRKQTTEDDEYDRIKFLTDSLHKAHPVRLDSVYNGADDGGSGTVALLEIAEALAKGPAKPQRSVLFVWHTGTEVSPTYSGSTWFTDHPTVSRDAIVAALNVDMIGRGEASDEVGITAEEDPRHGNADFVEVIGARRQSSEFAAVIEGANTAAKTGLKLDYAADAEGHPEALACRNDAMSYARFGIPVAFFTTGYHADFRQITDEPQYVRYQHMARVTRLVSATTLSLANLGHRLPADRPKPDPKAPCKP